MVRAAPSVHVWGRRRYKFDEDLGPASPVLNDTSPFARHAPNGLKCETLSCRWICAVCVVLALGLKARESLQGARANS